ncbi:endolytic transglycosylase MltG [Halalkalibacillus sediminis]|uniref:Endolytic murein transglycosylase n=1 Tax=Halalkalibacillus sediminis TaxID=2018042 RepID=A0A2I0QXL1_9BACI|nr:endolytic transglycosylase MltG [Halalkalibacillus sediminis]PKR79077.1 endolytic transglycosylase MltG [Halalkalibacillus sediminis]
MTDSNEKHSYIEQRNKRAKEAKISRRIILVVLLTLMIAIGLGGYYGYNYITEGLSPVDPDNEEIVDVEIPIGSSTTSIAETLEEKNLINDALIFQLYVKFKNESGFQAGEYQFSQSMTIDEYIESLKTGKILVEPLFTVTIPEGTTLEEIAEIYGEETSIDPEEFMTKMENEEYIQSLIDMYPNLLSEDILAEEIKYPLEGYLFGITYSFYEEDPSIEQVVEMMLQQTQNQLEPYMGEIAESDYTVHEALTMASLIEEEAVSEEDRFMIAGVFENRMNPEDPANEMPLQTDPTILYALGEHKDRVLKKDLDVESPYNTYQNRGLPPGPISNFRMNAFEAALQPREHDYFYFLADYEGEVHYAETNQEHNQNRQEHRPPQD